MKKFMFVLAGAVLIAVGSVQVGYALCDTECTICGTSGDDVLNGTEGDDVICGDGGNDVLKGKAGDDRLRTEYGDDIVDGGSGNDRIVDHGGDNNLKGGEGDDRIIFEGDGNNRVDAGGGHDIILELGYSTGYARGSSGNDIICAGPDLAVDGGEGYDFCDGGASQKRCEALAFCPF